MKSPKEDNFMVEREVRAKEDILDLIHEVKRKEKIPNAAIEQQCGIGVGSISKWKSSDPSIGNVLKVLSVVNVKLVLQIDESEKDNYHSELDMLIRDTAEKVLKNCKSLSDKERLYKVLQAFL